MDIDSLYKDFSNSSPKAPSIGASDTNVDALYKHFGGDTATAAPTEPLPALARPEAPVSGFTPEQSQRLNASFEEAGAYNKANPKTFGSKLGSAVAATGIQYWKNVKENASSAYDTYMKGFEDTASNKPASGLPEIALGAGGILASPLTGAFKTVGQGVTQATGNPDIGEKTEFLLGSGLPIAKGGSMIRAALPTNRAIHAIVNTIGKENLPEVIQELRSNSRLSLADVHLGVKQMAQDLVTTEGKQQDMFDKFVQHRVNTAKGTVESAYNDTMGVPVNVLEKLRDLQKAAADVGSKYINPAVAGSKPVDVNDVIAHIDSQLKPGIQSVITMGQPLPFGKIKKELSQTRKYLTDDKSVQTDPNELHKLQSGLRARADDLLNSASGQDRQLGHALMDVRNRIVNGIDEASPRMANDPTKGTYKPALGKYRDEKQVEDAFIKGYQITNNRPGVWEDRPEFWNEWINKATKEEISAAKEGARLAVDHQINGMKFGARKGSDIAEVEFNKQRLSALFGQNETDKLFKQLSDERKIADTNSKLIQGSMTAFREKGSSHVFDKKKQPISTPLGVSTFLAPLVELAGAYTTGIPGLSAVGLGGLKAGNIAKNLAIRKAGASKNEALGRLLTSTGQDREDLINALSQHLPQPKQGALQRMHNLALPVFRP
jgi:hypothetical protein